MLWCLLVKGCNYLDKVNLDPPIASLGSDQDPTVQVAPFWMGQLAPASRSNCFARDPTWVDCSQIISFHHPRSRVQSLSLTSHASVSPRGPSGPTRVRYLWVCIEFEPIVCIQEPQLSSLPLKNKGSSAPRDDAYVRSAKCASKACNATKCDVWVWVLKHPMRLIATCGC